MVDNYPKHNPSLKNFTGQSIGNPWSYHKSVESIITSIISAKSENIYNLY